MDADEGWEARMSARSAARRPEPNPEAVAWMQERRAVAVTYIRAHQTLGDAVDLIETGSQPCACVGDPCCFDRFANAEQLRRAAHITARLLSDATEKLIKEEGRDG